MAPVSQSMPLYTREQHCEMTCPASAQEDDFSMNQTESLSVHHYDQHPSNNNTETDPSPITSLQSSMEVSIMKNTVFSQQKSSLNCHSNYSTSTKINSQNKTRKHKTNDPQFQTKFALISTMCAMALLSIVAAIYSEWKMDDFYSSYGQNKHGAKGWGQTSQTTLVALGKDERQLFGMENEFWNSRNRHLAEEEDENDNNNNNGDGNDGDYSEYRCDDIFTRTSSSSSDDNNNDNNNNNNNNNEPSERCKYARTCESTGVLFPFVFCNNSLLSTSSWLIFLSPFLLLGLTILFRLLGSTAEEYFSPSLEMFSLKLGLPPRFAGVTLLALGNGAADVSATINAIASDPENGYLMSLGALTGAAMFITTCIAGAVIVVNGGLVCRGALVRDVMMLGITVAVVSLELSKGEVGPQTERTFISIYVVFVLTVFIADVYHRAIMLPRLQRQQEKRENERQVAAEKWASSRAGDALNSVAGGTSASVGGLEIAGNFDTGVGLERSSSAPPQLQDGPSPEIGNRALDAVLLALSNYGENDNVDDVDINDNRPNGWGIESTTEGNQSWDRPVVLHGPDGILTRHHHHQHTSTDGEYNEEDEFHSPYRVMEDMDLVDRLCVQEGSLGFPNINWSGAFQDGKQELMVHFRESWMNIFDDEENGLLDKFLLICEFPLTVCRKLTISIPCDGSYCRALVALSLALSPIWAGVYFMVNFDLNLWGLKMVIMLSISCFFGLLVLRYAPSGDGSMASIVAVPIALYGFMVAATWIDAVADKLVAFLEFVGIMLRIPNSIMGLTVLAWGNSMADLSANLTMARKGLANMAITACFAGPVFNILIGLGAGFGVLRGMTKQEVNYVHLTPSIKTGFVFCFFNCVILLIAGLVINKGVVPVGYGYVAIGMYALYIITSFVLQFLM